MVQMNDKRPVMTYDYSSPPIDPLCGKQRGAHHLESRSNIRMRLKSLCEKWARYSMPSFTIMMIVSSTPITMSCEVRVQVLFSYMRTLHHLELLQLVRKLA